MVELLWEAPLGAASWLFYRVNRRVLRNLYNRHLAKRPERTKVWRTISEKMLEEPGALPCMMTTGPRWNPHAVISATGPLTVGCTIEVDAAQADASAGEWTLVVHSFPDHALAGHLGRGGRSRLDVSPGRYILFLRYYHATAGSRLPAIKVDGEVVVESVELPRTANSVYEKLATRGSAYYRMLHGYVFPMLKYRRMFSESFVASEFLPVGNPETKFSYGHIEPGQSLEVKCDDACLASTHVYVTVYNRSSFPTQWCEVVQPLTKLPPKGAGFYLVRRHLRRGCTQLTGRMDARSVSPAAET